MRERSVVSIVDDDESVRESLPDLLRQFGLAAETFSSGEAFLKSDVSFDPILRRATVVAPGDEIGGTTAAIGDHPY